MLLEINIGLLAAVAIIASLLNVSFETKFANRLAASAVFLLGGSAVLSTSALVEITWSILHGIQPQETLFQAVMTNISLVLFLVGTELLAYIAFTRLRKARKQVKGGD